MNIGVAWVPNLAATNTNYKKTYSSYINLLDDSICAFSIGKTANEGTGIFYGLIWIEKVYE